MFAKVDQNQSKGKRQFKELLKKDEIIVAMGASTPLVGMLIERAGFPVVNVTGAGVSNMNFGLPDYGRELAFF